MICRNCGSPIFEGDRFCFKCGVRVVEISETEAGSSGTTAESKMISTPANCDAYLAESNFQPRSGAAEGITEQKKTADTEAAETIAGKKAAGKRLVPLSIPEEKVPKLKGRFRGRHKAAEPDMPERWVPRVILGILGMIFVVLTANSAKLVNFYHINFSTPEEYYRWVESGTIRKNARIFAQYYANHFVEYLHRYDSHASGEICVELGDIGRDRMELAGLRTWSGERTVTFGSTCKDSVLQNILSLEAGGEELFSMDVILDLKDEAAYLGFPGLTETYLAVDTEERNFVAGFEHVSGMKPEEYLRTLEFLEVLYEECPDRNRMEALADRYLELLLNRIEDVKMGTGKTIRAGSITQNCTMLEIRLDTEDMQSILTELLTELREDREVETLLYQVFELAEELSPGQGYYRDADDFYESFQEHIDEILQNLEYYITYHSQLDMTVYVDDRGQIIGRTIEFPYSRDEVSFSYINPHQGRSFGYKGSIRIDGREVSVAGSGKAFGNKVKGCFSIQCEGYGSIDVEVDHFDMKSLSKGYLNGCFTVTASPDSGPVWYSDAVYSYLSDMELTMDVSMNRSSEKMRIELWQDKELWGTLALTARNGSGRKIAVPSTRSAIFVDSEQDFEDWWNTLKWEEFLNLMNKAGVSADTKDAVEKFRTADAGMVPNELTELIRFLLYGYD